ncbi:MAG: Rrf2 family transcriptional regulator [bacterium]
MKLRKSTRYALFAATEMARLAPGETVTAGEVAGRHGIPVSVMAKVFQELVRADVALGVRGPRGGYRLAAAPAKITLLAIIDRFEPGAPEPGDTPRGIRRPANGADRLQRVVQQVDALVRAAYASISLEALVDRQDRAMPDVPAR